MNKTFTALLIKFLLTLGATWISFSLFSNATLGFVLTAAVAGTILNYVIGDLFILRTFGNIIAAIADAALAMLTAYTISIFTYNFLATTSTFIIFGIIIGIGEYFFHLYLLSTDEVAPNSEAVLFHDNDMEIGNNLDIDNDELNK